MKKLSTSELNRISVDDYKSTNKIPLVVVLDNIRSMHNVGAAFRTGDAFAIEKIFLCGITAKPPHRDIQKTALGAQDSVAWEYTSTTTEALEQLKADGYILCIIEQTDESVQLNEFAFESGKKYAVVFGNEAFGVEDAVLPLADVALEIPQFGTKHSLNVSVCLGVVLWEAVKGLR
ncbi:MAG TPA: RNA methyltransferase [Cytophagales bacterium]|nr:RNA methyltransferase [Cytophagales bacterium]HAA20188.1 RNA methyltransferase [Cytophagales bacterium]HAP58934.1 RNA methyltransferase [Cytophagales bacterium]